MMCSWSITNAEIQLPCTVFQILLTCTSVWLLMDTPCVLSLNGEAICVQQHFDSRSCCWFCPVTAVKLQVTLFVVRKGWWLTFVVFCWKGNWQLLSYGGETSGLHSCVKHVFFDEMQTHHLRALTRKGSLWLCVVETQIDFFPPWFFFWMSVIHLHNW